MSEEIKMLVESLEKIHDRCEGEIQDGATERELVRAIISIRDESERALAIARGEL